MQSHHNICPCTPALSLVSTSHVCNFIADVPLPPSPEFLLLNLTAALVVWDEPFTWQDFPITNYTMEVADKINEELLASEVLSPDTLSYAVTVAVPFNLTFSVRASNSIGTSMPGTVQGAIATGEFMLYNKAVYCVSCR